VPYWNPQNLVGNSRPFFKWPAKIAYQIQRDAEVYAYGSTYTNNVNKIQNTIVATGACGQWVEYAGGSNSARGRVAFKWVRVRDLVRPPSTSRGWQRLSSHHLWRTRLYAVRTLAFSYNWKVQWCCKSCAKRILNFAFELGG
jgi:hypothetical protein